ncbi:tyrosine-type recombinase/integrase [Cobetia sp. L2A1]|uniref:tyrosine-type recombinase/integrase n=1 Tax=Cobetia sp. L2A1 TaxID=2686360 RepID=UPI00131A6C79|nr:tyrosine-type recombinase/integrase [Cobetia sp. L2A1]
MNDRIPLESIEPTTYQITTVHSSLKSIKYLDITQLELKEKHDIKVSVSSRYEDNIWDFHVEFPYSSTTEVSLSFRIELSDGTLLTDDGNKKFLEQAKDFYYTMLTDPVDTRPKFSTYVKTIKRGFKWLFSYMKRNGIKKLSDIEQYDVDEFLEQVASTRIKGKEQEPINNRTLATRLEGVDWIYEQNPKMKDGLEIDIFSEYGGRSRWSRAAAEVVFSRKESRTVEMPDEVARELIQCAISDLRISDCLQEIYDIDIQYERKMIGYKEWVSIREVIYQRHGYLEGRIERQKRATLESQLFAACYTIIALLTGMRLHEVLNIQFGSDKNWCAETLEMNGQLFKLSFVLSKTTKLEPKPTEYKWQTVPIVKSALEALEKVSKRNYDNGSPWLFSGHKSSARMGKGAIGHSLKNFAVKHDIRFNGEVWDLASHQFRKKFARIMVRQGLGLRALQDQLKHYDIEMTKLYGDPNLYFELQAEKFLLSEELMTEFIGSQIPIIGGGAVEIQEIRKEFLGLAKKDRGKFLKSLPSQGLVEQTDDGLCFYRAKKALCGGDKTNCRPADCNNSFMVATGKKKTLLYRRKENNRLIEFFRDQPFKIMHLKERNKEIDKLLFQITLIESSNEENI